MAKRIARHVHKETPNKDRMALVILFGVFVFTVLMDLAAHADRALQAMA